MNRPIFLNNGHATKLFFSVSATLCLIAARAVAATISGQLHPPTGTGGLAGPSTIRASNGGGATNTTDGNYSLVVPNGWSGVIVVERVEQNGQRAAFTPSYRGYTNVTSNFTGQDYTILPNQPQTISGTITNTAGQGVFEVLVTATLYGGAALTASNGAYYLGYHPQGPNWSGTVTPSKPGITFSPTSRTYTAISTNQFGQNYTASSGGGGGDPRTNLAAVATNKIVFSRLISGNTWNLFLMDIDGSNEVRLTTSSYWDTEPQFSPDGATIVFCRIYSTTPPRSSDVIRIDARGFNETNLTASITNYVEYPKYSWDGQWIVFQRQGEGTAMDIWKMRSDGSSVTPVETSTNNDQYPSFSPDGNWIVFKRETAPDPNPRSKICKVPAGGGSVVDLTPDDSPVDETPVYSPDGRYILFKRGHSQWDLFRMPHDHDPSNTNDLVNMTQSPTTSKGGAVYSWEGDKIYYQATTSGTVQNASEIFVMNSDGSNKKRLTFNEVADWDPSVSPCSGIAVLSLSKNANSLTVTGGQVVAFTLSATNSSGTAASNTVVRDTLHAALSCLPETITGGGQYTENTRTIEWSLGVLTGGTGRVLGFSAQVDPAVPPNTTITNLAHIARAPGVTNFSNTVALRTPLPEMAIGMIAFMSDRDGDYDLYLIPAEGGEEINLTRDTYNDMNPHFRFDGRRILYDSDRTGTNRLYSIQADGTDEICLTAHLGISAQRGKWSWDGSQIVFQSGALGNGNIYRMAATGGPCTAITSDDNDDEWPSFSPDGQWIVFQRMTGSMKTRLYRIRTDGTGLTALTDGSDLDEMPYYSPDGQYVIFKRGTSSLDIYRINASDGSGLTNLTTSSGQLEDAPIFSYEGTKFAFQSSSGTPTTTEIVYMNVGQTNRYQITTNNFRDWNPTFSPVGHLIVATAGTYGSLNPSGSIRVFHNRGTNFVITASNNYVIARIETNGVPVPGVGGSSTNFIWQNVTASGTLYVAFAANLATNGVPITWLQQYYPETNDYDAAALSDTDSDGAAAWEEYFAGTDPTNPKSVLQMTEIQCQTENAIVIRWQSASNRFYRLDRATNLLEASPFSVTIGSNLPATPPLNTETDKTAVGKGPFFYRIKLE